MNESKTPKILVGAGLVAVYASVAFYLLRDTPDSNIAQLATTAPTVPMAAVPVPPPAMDPAFTDASTSVVEQPAVVTEAPAPATRATADVVEAPAPKPEPVQAKAQGGEQPVAGKQEAASEPITASAGNDSQITADVKTQIAAASPASSIEVTTTDGVVELSGSVPSQEEINKVSLVARSVAHVRGVDASALMVSN